MNRSLKISAKSSLCLSTQLSSVSVASKIVVAALLAQLGASTALAVPYSLAQQPAGTGGREPAPNVILSIDDSGSMGWDVNGCMTMDWDFAYYGSRFDAGASAGNCPARESNPNPSRMASLKSALFSQFGDASLATPTKGKIPDGRIRLAWQAMWNNGRGNDNQAGNLTVGNLNSMKPFSGTHRANFSSFVTSLRAKQGTPSHKMMENVYNYMRSPVGDNSPWADNPGSSQSTAYLACRRTYHVFMTDGAWNTDGGRTAGNADGSSLTLGDGITSYSPTSSQSRVYKDGFGAEADKPSTLADFAFRSWATDLQDGTGSTQNMANSVRPLIRKSGTETVINPANGHSTALQEFWNSKNDPATWQHIVQHTIGFGNAAVTWSGVPVWDPQTDNTYGGDYAMLVNGDITWQNPIAVAESNRSFELWHMALNGRGKFYPARNAEALTAAFSDILDNVIIDTSTSLVSVAANASRIQTDTLVYVAGYESAAWNGHLQAYAVTNAGVSSTASWDAATLLSAAVPANRVVLSYNGSAGIPFRWGSLPSSSPAIQRTYLNSADTRGAERVDYLRGVRTTEGAAANTFRTRTSVLGDIVNSNIWYLGAPTSASGLAGYAAFASANASRVPMLYVGANDGMLHGFVASSGANRTAGSERIAYVPAGAYPNLSNYTQQAYTHRYFVDGSPFSGDVKVGSTWRTYLAGFMGAGGKGYFVLDVTDPSTTNFAESNASSLVVLDKTMPTDDDVGSIFAQPSKDPANPTRAVQFTMMNNDRPALILGNGVNSTNERPVLLIQYLDGAKEVLPLIASTATGGSNGLGNPQVIDINGDGKADLVYAGDLKGNLWKFDVSKASPSNWKVSFGGNPLYTAADSGGTRQPIMTAPVWLPHPKGGIMLGFTTGRTLTSADRTDTSQQTLYGVWDNTVLALGANQTLTVTDDPAKRVTDGQDSLVQQNMGTVVLTTVAGRSFFTHAANPVNYGTTGINPNRRGWYMNFTDSGERASSNPYWFNGNYVMVPSAVPASGTDSNTETCSLTSVREVGSLTVVDLIKGAPPKLPVFDTDGGGFTGSEVVSSKVSNQDDSVSFSTGGGQGKLLGTKCIGDGNCSGLGTDKHWGGTVTGWRER
ncbi:MAG: hypothetical protein A3I66_20400 [Burkholderiales bacterium RIFCSPLOWO2_02_FULL_57_36]|nr:MAG: hypothetical protein A3I66_20400 [Burkholderiales bacterium RIFCSPLOWO2_02_FULL_57_36]